MTNDKSKPKAKRKKIAGSPAVQKRKPTAEVDLQPAAPAPQSAFSVGDWVHHPMFGDGKVEAIVDDKLMIKFDANVTKEIREDFVTRKR
jgi:hypothetical protein